MNKEQTAALVAKQRAYFNSGRTLSVQARRDALLSLRASILRHEADLYDALKLDLNRPKQEAFTMELYIVLNEIDYFLKHLNALCARKRVPSPVAFFKTTSYLYPEPYGIALILSPWNYPIQLALAPLAGAIAAGNCAVVKPSEYSAHSAAVVERILTDAFLEEFVAVVRGGREENRFLLEEKFDYIFFTGSYEVGKVVMRAAAEYLTPLTLELGGKSPCLVDETANIDLAAKRIIWGKLVNGGQTCVAPDYVLVHASVKQALIERMKHYIARFYGEKPLENPNYAKIINQKHFERLCGLMRGEHLATGGDVNPNTLQIAPAILDEAKWGSPVMSEEIFGPLLPVIAYEDMEQAVAAIRARPKPLAFYFFTSDASREKDILPRLAFGGGCVNDTLIHVGTHHLPFGGVGESGMGNYHGKSSFDAFTHYKGVAKKSLLVDLPIRFPPFREERFSFVRMLSRRK